MFKPFAAFAIAASIFAVPTASALTPADLQRCQAMAATLTPKQAEIERVKAKRDEYAENVETLGEAWQEAEVHRLVSAGHAAKADEALMAYEEVERGLSKLERGLQGLVVQYNKDIYAYNKSCATED